MRIGSICLAVVVLIALVIIVFIYALLATVFSLD